MTSSELKKLRRKQRKAELKAQAKVQEEKKGQCVVIQFVCKNPKWAFRFSWLIFCLNTENKPKANESEKKAADEKEEELDPVKLVMV